MGMGLVLIHWDQCRVEYWRQTNVLGELGEADTRGPGLLQPPKGITALPKDGVVPRGPTMPSLGVCMAWDKEQVLTGRGPALLSSCFAAQGRETKDMAGNGTSIRM